MDARGYQPKNFGFAREARSNNSRKVHPNDEESDPITNRSTNQDRSTHSVPQSSDQLLNSTQNTSRTKTVASKTTKSAVASTSTKGLLLAAGILSVVILITVIPSVLGVILTRNQPVPSSTTSSTAAPPSTTAFWNFDGTTNDMFGTYNGALLNGATYSNNTYFGLGFNLFLNETGNQSMSVTSRFLNLSYTSFTLEAWILGASFSGDSVIFSQCQCFTCQDRCLFMMIRNSRMFMSFTADDVIGVTTMATNTWHHVAFVYDYSTQTQSIYLQGVLENSKTSSGPYLGQNGSIFIGTSQIPASSFNGLIDNVRLTTRAKTAAEVLTSATVVTYFSFDGPTLSEDMGPNKMNGTISNAAAATGRVGQGLAFSGTNTSYLQIYGYFQLGIGSRPFTLALWVYPYVLGNSGVIIQKSSFLNTTYWCYSMLGMNFLGQISMVLYASGAPSIIGPILPARTWTHLGYTYSTTNGVRMYINGALYATIGPYTMYSSGTIDYLTIGSYQSGGYCGLGSGAIVAFPYNGVIDEFYVYRRELTASQISILANP